MSPQIGGGTRSGSGSGVRLSTSRVGGGHCPTCTCNGRGDLLQKETSPQGVLSTVKDLEKRIGRLESATRQGTRTGLLNSKGKRKGGAQFGGSTGGSSASRTGFQSGSGGGGSQLGGGSGGGPSLQ